MAPTFHSSREPLLVLAGVTGFTYFAASATGRSGCRRGNPLELHKESFRALDAYGNTAHPNGRCVVQRNWEPSTEGRPRGIGVFTGSRPVNQSSNSAHAIFVNPSQVGRQRPHVVTRPDTGAYSLASTLTFVWRPPGEVPRV